MVVAIACGTLGGPAEENATGGVCDLNGLVVSPAVVTLHVGDTLRISAQLQFCGAKPTYADFRWQSNDTSIARVDSLIGLIHARARGQVSIIASAVLDPTVKASALVSVIP